MSTENPLLYSPSAPWAMVDMAAVMFPSTSSKVCNDPLEDELMDLDSMGLLNSSPLHQQVIFRPCDNSPQSLKSWGATFSFDSSILEELLADNTDVSSRSVQELEPTTKVESDHHEQQEPQQQLRKSVSDCLADALRIISCSEPDALAQVWVPILRGNKLLLTTQEQPYSVVPVKGDLMTYRRLSTGYVFPSHKDAEAYPGLPGRVFSRLTPEWTPNVQYYDCREYLRVQDAALCDVKGSLAVPVVDPSSKLCLGVIELVTTVEKVEYSSELNTICRALEAVNLSAGTEGNLMLPTELSTKGREAVFGEITDVLTRVCGAHKLPLAQTWLPCVHSGVDKAQFCFSTGPVGTIVSLSTKEAPYFVADIRYRGFHQACSEHTLEKGQGVPGKAFISNQPSFMPDIRSFSKEEYPLVHYARFFKLGAAVAIRLRSLETGSDDYILEFFLPSECRDCDKQQQLLSAVSVSMQRACKTLRVVRDEECRKSVEVGVVEQERLSGNVKTASKKHSTSSEELDSTFHKSKKTRQGDNAGTDPVSATGTSAPPDSGGKRRMERKRNVGEKTISLEVLQQYFAGSLKDAAKSIGVCPTTLKRICRQYGISRWPSRKINKVSRSLIKLQGVIDSVQGIDGGLRLNSLTGEFASTAAAAAAITKRNTVCEDRKMAEERQQQTGAYLSKNSSCSRNDQNLDSECSRGMKRSQSCTYPRHGGLMSPLRVGYRVHGSCAALAALQTGLMDDQLPCPPPPEENDASAGMQTWSSAEDLSRMEGGHGSSSPYISSGDCASPLSPPEGHGDLSAVSVKASFGADTIRFKMPASFGHRQLKEEVTNRFKLEQESFSLRYLDDDAEWVILEGDADLEECLDIMKMAHSHTIKLAVKDGPQSNTSCHSLSSVKL